MRFAYADPPYLGCAARLYGDPTYDSIEAHAELIAALAEYDGWAYSLNSTTLQELMPILPKGVRFGAWVKPWCAFKPNVNPAYAWEPVVFYGGRPYARQQDTVRDWIAANITMQKGLAGAKPLDFSFWIFQLLNMQADDEFIDLFPGTGEVMRAWHLYRASVSQIQVEMFV